MPIERNRDHVTLRVAVCAQGQLSAALARLQRAKACKDDGTAATAVAVSAVGLGQAIGFVVGPTVVGPGSPSDSPATARAQLDRLFYAEFAATCLVCLMCVAYYPDQPHEPPSEMRVVGASRTLCAISRY